MVITKALITFVIVAILSTNVNGVDKYTDENRPYEFGFTIDGEQHRHEKKDENGIIMGEFGFITADGVYHVTVYATDENGRFKILSMKNIRVKPYPGTATQNSRTGHSLALPDSPKTTSAPVGTSAPYKNSPQLRTSLTSPVQNNNQADSGQSRIENTPKPAIQTAKQPAAPVRSCSHCSVPTTTTVSPIISSNIQQSSFNQGGTSNSSPFDLPYNQFSNQPQSYQPQSVQQQQTEHYNNQGNSEKIPTFNNQHNDKTLQQEAYPGQQNYNNQRNPELTPTLNNQDVNKQKDSQESLSYPGQQSYTNQGNPETTSTLNNQDINKQRNLQDTFSYPSQQNYNNQGLYENSQNVESNHDNSQTLNGPSNTPLLRSGFNNPAYPNSEVDLPNIDSYEGNPKTPDGQGISVSNAPLQSRGPKSYEPSLEQKTIGGVNLNNYDISNPPKSPKLLAAQMQVVDKNTDIYHKNPGEQDGLPDGVTKDYMMRVLYVFNYTVGFHGHYEKGFADGSKQGYYYVTGRNGVRTRVDYEADEKGFRPKITEEVLDLLSEEVPKPETEKEPQFGLKSYEFKWFYFPVGSKQR